MAERIQLRRTKGWRKPEGAIVVARSSKWGNPWRITRCWRTECSSGPSSTWCVFLDSNTRHLRQFDTERAARVFAVSRFHAWIRVDIAVEQLAGHDLACWCPLDQPCHADVLLEIANA